MGLKIPDLDNTTFEQLVEEARSLIARYAPQWTDHNLHDPGITFIDLFAWLAEMQVYQLNQVTDDLYRKFLQLVGIVPRDAQPAVVDITFANIHETIFIEKGTPLFTKMGADRMVFKTAEEVTLVPLAIKSVQTIADSRLIDQTTANEKDDMYFYAFGKNVPKGAKLRLGFDQPLKDKDIYLTFELREDDLPSDQVPPNPIEEPLPVIPSVTLAWEYLEEEKWKSFDIKNDTTLGLSKSGKIVFSGPPAAQDIEEGVYWVRCRVETGQYEIVPLINRILLNTVPALQIETVKEILGEGNDLPDQVFGLEKQPINRESLLVEVQGGDFEWEKWEEKEDFECSGPDDPHYVYKLQKREIVFGNGLNGCIPKKSRRIRATYESTLGFKGNIPQDQDFRIDKRGFEGIKGKNSKPSSGGKDAESIEEAINRARKDLKYSYRAITAGDYEKLALETPGIRVRRAKALPGYNPGFPCISLPGVVTVVVVPYTREGTINPVPGEGFLQTVLNHLERCRLITTDLYVIAPAYVKVSVNCRVKLRKKSSPEKVKERVQEKLKEFLDPLKGGPGKTGWPFGRAVYPSEIYQLIDNIEGVDYAAGVSLQTEEKQYKEGEPIIISPISLVYSGDHQVNIIGVESEREKNERICHGRKRS